MTARIPSIVSGIVTASCGILMAYMIESPVSTIESGIMTGDLVALFHREGVTPKKVGSVEFLEAVAKAL